MIFLSWSNQKDPIAGTWKGTSLCQVKDSPCHDEIAIYHAVKAEGNNYRFQMNKMVNGKEVEMGETVFAYDHLYLGGGNSRLVSFKLPSNVSTVSNDAGMEGGAFAWTRYKS